MTDRLMKSARNYKLTNINISTYGKDDKLSFLVGNKNVEDHGNITTLIQEMPDGLKVVTHYNDEQRKVLIEFLKSVDIGTTE